MKLYEFKSLEGRKKFNIIDQSGELIAERKDDFCKVSLFQIENFYVEVYKHHHFNVVTRMRSFENTDLLEPYFQNMQIESLLLA